MDRKRSVLFVLLGAVVFLGSCSSLATRCEVLRPQCVSSISSVGLAPIVVDGHTLSVCRDARSIALEALLTQIEQSSVFTVIPADTLLAYARQDSIVGAEALLAAANRLGLDAVLFCRLDAYEGTVTKMETVGWRVSFGEDGFGMGPVEEAVTKTTWIGSKVSVQIAEASSGHLVATTQFDTHKGKSYWKNPPVEQHIADAVEGAFKPIDETWAR